jgi:dCTP deaminase
MNASILNGKGTLPSQTIIELIRAGFIQNAKEENVRPASLDLSISDEIYSVDGIFQPAKGETIRKVLAKINKKKHPINKPLLHDQIYLIRLNEKLELPHSVYGFLNPRSTSGRIDLHVRLIADGVARYDSVDPGFDGELWVFVIPKTFPIKLFEGVSLNQIRFFNLDTRLNPFEVEVAVKNYKLLWYQDKGIAYKYEDITVSDKDGSIVLTLDLDGDNPGYEGVVSDNVVDLSQIGFYDHKKFFKKMEKKDGLAYLKKGAFYLLATHEAVRVPPELACEMIPMDGRSAEFRSHYAGFIDPGWGWGIRAEGKGRPLTLEVRPLEDLIVRHGQPIAKVIFERMTDMPPQSYDTISSNYTVQSGPMLAKHFKV